MDTTDSARQIAKWNTRYGLKDPVWSIEPNRLLVEELEGLEAGRALDLGAGEGRHAVWLTQQNWQVTAIDFAAQGIARGKVLAAERQVQVEWICADLMSYPLASSSYDLVIMLYLHIPATERKVIVRRAVSSLKPGGHFVYIGHDPRNILEGQGGPQNPEVLCSATELAADLAGFQILSSGVRKRPIAQEQGHGEMAPGFALDTLVHGIKPQNMQ